MESFERSLAVTLTVLTILVEHSATVVCILTSCSGAASEYSAVASLSISLRSLNLIGIDLALIL
jgi:hypothetical protein